MRIPAHIGIIPDGNRRWAQAAGQEKQAGYRYGLSPGEETVRLARAAGVREITFYGFTVDNCRRPRAQVEAFSEACVQAASRIARQPCSLLVLGDTASKCFPQALRRYTTRTDCAGGGIRVNLLVNYGWDWDLSGLTGARPTRPGVLAGLRSADVSRMDLIIRWGGMRRLSGFLPVQSVYADFFVVDHLWPDFEPGDFARALDWYGRQDVTLGG